MANLFGYKIEKTIPEHHHFGQKKVSIWLDSYDDIFSDFDPSPYNQRHISEDFYNQLRKFGIEDMEGQIEIDLLIDEKKRDIALEKMIHERILEFFSIHYRIHKRKRNRILMQSLLFMLLGTLFILILTLGLKKYDGQLSYILLIKLLEPASWFLSWEGLHLLFFEYVEGKDKEDFHRNMSHARIAFENKI